MALAKARDTKQRAREPYSFGVAAGKKIWAGSLVVLDGGYAKPGETATGLQAAGRAAETVDNSSGDDGDQKIRVEPGVFKWLNSANADEIGIEDVGAICFIVDDQTVALTSGTATRSIGGVIMDVDATGAWVYTGVDADISAALAAEIALRESLITDLAATTNGDGASLIGIEDAAALFTGTTVEAALAEKLSALRVANTADSNLIGGVPTVHIVPVPDGATGDVDVVLTHKFEVQDVTVIKTGAAGGGSDTITVKNGATAITNALDINVADKVVVRAGTIDDASNVIAALGTLRVTRTKVSAANVACQVRVVGVRRA